LGSVLWWWKQKKEAVADGSAVSSVQQTRWRIDVQQGRKVLGGGKKKTVFLRKRQGDDLFGRK
jgi:hypothetical protein